jgi:hypothetical protein
VKNEYLEYPVIKLAVDNQIIDSGRISEKSRSTSLEWLMTIYSIPHHANSPVDNLAHLR